MKYFTKYLPVPEEIKEGDTFVCATPYGDKYTASSIKNGYVYTSPLSFRFRIKDCIVLKLFLCSRDIQVGDEVIGKDGERFIWSSDIVPKEHTAFKVIGEVSPNAIWVKEGMEFEASDIKEYWGKEGSVGFKCPTCNTFH